MSDPAAPPAPPTADIPADDDPRRRLLRGLVAAVADKGYAATTIADIVRHARVSKRTFYEQFDDKLACYLESYRRGTGRLARRMLEAGTAAEGPWEARLRAAIRAYLAVLVEAPASTRTFTTEVQAAGPEAVAARLENHRRTAEAMMAVVDHVRLDAPGLRPLEPVLADAIVGAMTELVAIAVTDGRTDELLDLDAPVLTLLTAVVADGRPQHPE
jgi:AcrR family transcriptional regulator